MNIYLMYNYYVEFLKLKEKYEIVAPTMSAHNLIIGNFYIDISGKSTIKNCSREGEECVLEYSKRGWYGKSAQKVVGSVFNSKKEVIYKIEGNWSSKIYLVNAKNPNDKELIFQKNPYPENWELMYGMSHFML